MSGQHNSSGQAGLAGQAGQFGRTGPKNLAGTVGSAAFGAVSGAARAAGWSGPGGLSAPDPAAGAAQPPPRSWPAPEGPVMDGGSGMVSFVYWALNGGMDKPDAAERLAEFCQNSTDFAAKRAEQERLARQREEEKKLAAALEVLLAARQAMEQSAALGTANSASALEEIKYGLGLGTRAALSGILDLADLAATPVRAPMNLINGALGGDPEYLKPTAELVPDAIGLPKPQNNTEIVLHNIQRGLGSFAGGFGLGAGLAPAAGSAAQAGKSAGQIAGEALTARPGAQAISAAASGGALGAAQAAGAGPLAQTAAAILGGALAPGTRTKAGAEAAGLKSSPAGGPAGGAPRLEPAARPGAKDRLAETPEALQPQESAAPGRETATAATAAKGKERQHKPPPDFTDRMTAEQLRASELRILNTMPTPGNYIYVFKPQISGSREKVFKSMQNLRNQFNIEGTLIEISPGKLAMHVDYVPPPPSRKAMDGAMARVYRAFLNGESMTVELGIVGPREAARIQAHSGVDTLLCRHTFGTGGIEHGFRRHGKETRTGQISLTEIDFIRYPEIIHNPQIIKPGNLPNSILYARRYPDGTIYVCEHKKGGGSLKFTTMWKQVVGGSMVCILAVEDEDGE